MSNQISGVLPVLHTPLTGDGEIDWAALRAEINWAIEVGADGVVAAMVSEVLRMSRDERLQLTDVMVETTQERGAVITSVGADTIDQATEFTRHAEKAGCSAVMAIPPIRNALTDDQLWAYFSEISECVDLPVIVQDASSYVGGRIATEFYVRLIEQFGEDKILFKPEASPVGPNLSALREQSGGRAKVLDGSGGIYLIDAFRRGIVGTMPGTDLLDGIVALWQALNDGNEERAYEVYFPICAIVSLQLQAGLDGFLAIEKHLMVRRGIFSNEQRRPPIDWQLDHETRREVDRLFDRLQQLLTEPH